MAGSTQFKSQQLKNMSVHAHEVSSNGGGIATNRSIRTQMSKASQRFTKTATPNRSVTRRSQPSRKSIKQLSEKDLDLGANPLMR